MFMPTVPRPFRRYGVLVSLLLSLTALSPASVLAAGWSQVASTCTPDDNTLLTPDRRVAVKYDFRGAAFQFQPRVLSVLNWMGLPAPITVRCHVLNPYENTTPRWGQLIVSYQDPDGIGTGSRVIAYLVRSFRPSGTQVIAAFDSNMYDGTAVFIDRSVSFDHDNLDFSNSDYFVEIHLYRTILVNNPRVLRVRLDE